MGRQMPIAQQHERRAHLITLQDKRALLPTEVAELASLEHRAYMRTWRALGRPARRAQRSAGL